MSQAETEKDLYHPEKGDVCYVPWRKQYWPALVKHSYPKKITYAFFPLSTSEKSPIFTLTQPKKSKRLRIEDGLPADSAELYRTAFDAAKFYLKYHGITEGWKCNVIDSHTYLTNGFDLPPSRGKRDGTSDEEGEASSGEEEESNVSEKEPSESDKDENEHPKLKKRRLNRSGEGINPEEDEMIEDSNVNHTHYEFHPGKLLKLTQGVPINMIIFENIDSFLSEVWDSNEVRHYKVPERCDLNLKLPYARILNDNDADLLFEHCLNFVRMHEPECRTLPAIDLVTSVIFPEVILRSLSRLRNITHEEASKYMASLTSTYSLDNSQTALAFLASVATEANAPTKEDEESVVP